MATKPKTPHNSSAGHSSSGRPRPLKGGRTFVDDGGSKRVPPTPLVLVFTSTDENTKLSSLNPFRRLDGFRNIGDEPHSATRQRDGSLLVQYQSEAAAARALKASVFKYRVGSGSEKRCLNTPISVSPHSKLNNAKGVVFCRALEGVDNDEICDGLASQGVVRVERIVRRREGKEEPTHSFFLTFDSASLPDDIKIGDIRQRIRVRPYVPNPMRCFKCQKFGHTSSRCTRNEICGRCSSEKHSTASCNSDTVRCVNCQSREHGASSRACPEWLKEKEILSIRATRNVGFNEAREIYRISHPSGPTFSNVVKTSAPAPQSVDQFLEKLTVADFIKLAGRMGLRMVAPEADSRIVLEKRQPVSAAHQRPVKAAEPRSSQVADRLVRQPSGRSDRPTPVRLTGKGDQTPLPTAEKATKPTQLPSSRSHSGGWIKVSPRHHRSAKSASPKAQRTGQQSVSHKETDNSTMEVVESSAKRKLSTSPRRHSSDEERGRATKRCD